MTAADEHHKAQGRIVRMLDALVVESEQFLHRSAGTVAERHYHRAQLKMAKAATGAAMRATPPKGTDHAATNEIAQGEANAAGADVDRGSC